MQKCLKSIPVQKHHATHLVQSTRAWVELHSQVDHLSRPMPGYLFDAVNITRALDEIRVNLEKDRYASHYDYEIDMMQTIYYGRDFHFSYQSKFIASFAFVRPDENQLVSVSSDGLALPSVYLYTDLYNLNAKFAVVSLKSRSGDISPITKVNNLPVQEFLQTQMLVQYSHDPDSQYNQIMYNAAQTQNPGGSNQGSYSLPVYYPGPHTTLTFQNGSTVSLPNAARVNIDLSSVTSGQSYFAECCMTEASSSKGVSMTGDATPGRYYYDGRTFNADTVDASSGATPATTTATNVISPGYPTPFIRDSKGIISGYFMPNTDIAIMVLRAFEGSDDLSEFQMIAQYFFGNATAGGYKKLIIDVQGNGGGFVDLGTDLIGQLFPQSNPDASSDMRSSLGFSLVLKKVGQVVQAAVTARKDDQRADAEQLSYYDPYAWQSVMSIPTSPNASNTKGLSAGVRPFNDFNDFYGPHQRGVGNFTSLFQNNYTNTNPSQSKSGKITITGQGTRKHFKQPFTKENVVILSDGFCGSTCSNFVEYATNPHGIPSIVVGGRPQHGPMQTVGNTRGSQVFRSEMTDIIDWWNDRKDFPVNRSLAEGTVFAKWDDFALKQGLVGINARNAYRIGDKSLTPLQQIYAAADCKFWYTSAMIADPVQVWSRTAEIAFNSRTGVGRYTSKYCVKNSTGHSTSVTGGLRPGSIGPQTPPAGAKPKYVGFLLNGTRIHKGYSLADRSGNKAGVYTGPANTDTERNSSSSSEGSPHGTGDVRPSNPQGTITDTTAHLSGACDSYTGSKWLTSLICGWVNH